MPTRYLRSPDGGFVPYSGGGGSSELEERVGKVEKAIADKADTSGWTPDKYIGTDAEGNLVEKDAPAGGGIATVTDKPYTLQNIGVLYENPEGYDYIAWCPGNLRYDPNLDKYVSLIYGSTRHVNGTTALFVAYIDPKTYEATAPVQCYTDDGATALKGSTAFWIDDDGSYKMLYKYTDNNTYLYMSADNGVNWVQGDKVSGFSGSPWGITKLSNGRLIFGDDVAKVGIYYSDDGGVTWKQVIPTSAGGNYEAEACILELEPGKLIAIARYSMSGIGYNASGDSEPAIVSYSEDYGTTWTAWKKSTTITNMNASTCTGRVHNGMVDIFAASRWYWHGDYSNTDYDNTGKTGAITHYTATVANALIDNFTNYGIVTYANAVGDTSSQDFHSPVLAAKGDDILLMWFDRIYPYTEEVTSYYFARGAVGMMNYAPNDNLVTTVFPYSSAMVEKLLKQQYNKLMVKINEIVISGGGTPDEGDDPENPYSYVFDGIVMNMDYLDETKYDTENMTLTDTINGITGTFVTADKSQTVVETFPEIRNNSVAPDTWLRIPASNFSNLFKDSDEFTVEVALNIEEADLSNEHWDNVGDWLMLAFNRDSVQLGIRPNELQRRYLISDGSVGSEAISSRFKKVMSAEKQGFTHGTFVYSAEGKLTTYQNGELFYVVEAPSDFAKWDFGVFTSAYSQFHAPFKTVRLYKRALTAEEVLNNYNYELQSLV